MHARDAATNACNACPTGCMREMLRLTHVTDCKAWHRMARQMEVAIVRRSEPHDVRERCSAVPARYRSDAPESLRFSVELQMHMTLSQKLERLRHACSRSSVAQSGRRLTQAECRCEQASEGIAEDLRDGRRPNCGRLAHLGADDGVSWASRLRLERASCLRRRSRVGGGLTHWHGCCGDGKPHGKRLRLRNAEVHAFITDQNLVASVHHDHSPPILLRHPSDGPSAPPVEFSTFC